MNIQTSLRLVRSCKTPLILVFLFLCLVLPICAHAVPLGDSLSVRPAVQSIIGKVDTVSYDGPGYNAFSPFAGGVNSQDVYKVDSFTGHDRGSHLEVFLLSEIAAFDGNHDPSIANQFGVLNSNGDFISLINSAVDDPLASASITQAPGEELTLALKSPEGLFSSIDADNPDKAMHILAKKVESDREIEVPSTTLQSTDPLKFSLLAGDIILFIEDMLIAGNEPLLGVPSTSDFDYNDMVVVVRQVEVPEPATVLLFGPILFGLRRLKRKS